jgi:hypothetical protein
MSNFRWGLIIALAPIAVPFVLWPLWWLAGCEPSAHAVNCKNAMWYGPIAMAILSIPWLAFLSIPAGFIVMMFGPIPSGTQALHDPSAMPRQEAARDKEKDTAD